MDSSVHAIIAAQYIQDRIGPAGTARAAREARRRDRRRGETARRAAGYRIGAPRPYGAHAQTVDR
jgi:hypothetical protein